MLADDVTSAGNLVKPNKEYNKPKQHLADSEAKVKELLKLTLEAELIREKLLANYFDILWHQAQGRGGSRGRTPAKTCQSIKEQFGTFSLLQV